MGPRLKVSVLSQRQSLLDEKSRPRCLSPSRVRDRAIVSYWSFTPSICSNCCGVPHRLSHILSTRQGPHVISSSQWTLSGKDPCAVFHFLTVGHLRAKTVSSSHASHSTCGLWPRAGLGAELLRLEGKSEPIPPPGFSVTFSFSSCSPSPIYPTEVPPLAMLNIGGGGAGSPGRILEFKKA